MFFLVVGGLWLRPALAQPGADAPPASSAGQVDLQFLQVGVGNVVRPGEWFGLRIQATDRATKAREVVVRLALPDADGDPALYQRIVTLNPGVKQAVWLYARLPFSAAPQFPLRVDVFEALDGVDASAPGRVGGLLGSAVYRLQRVVHPATGLLPIVGRPRVGLDYYGVRWMGNDFAPTGHESTELVDGLRVADLPDRWLGLAPYGVIVWSGSGPGEEPSDLAEPQASALREWVQRGGHLVVVLPAAGQLWTNAGNPVLDLVPKVTVERRDGVPLEPLRRLLTAGRQPLPERAILQVLEPAPGARPDEASRVMADPDGKALVTRRLVGNGAVTLVGFDLTNRTLLGVNGVQPDVFWHRVLGRRGKLHSQEDLNRMANPRDGQNRQYFDRREARYYDLDVPALVNKKGRAAVGVLLALVVFVGYWLAAGPLGFAALRARKWTHHAWVAFVGACGVFTLAAWGGAGLLRPRTVEGQHVTILDHVYGQPLQRARVWASLLLPSYGLTPVDIERESDERLHNALASFDAPGEGGGGAAFTDARAYVVNSGRPDGAVYPTRSTVKTVQADWAGGPRWKMPLPQGGADAALRLTTVTDPATRSTRHVVRGTLTHQLPAALTSVEVIVVRDQRPLSAGATELLLFTADAFTLTQPWEPGKPLSLDEVTGPRPNLGDTSLLRWVSRLTGGISRAEREQEVAGRASPDALQRLRAITFFPLFEPPNTGQLGAESPLLARRRLTHGYDLGRWFTQPCVIIQGWMGEREGDGPCPVPITVGGEPVAMSGRTLVRWIYPLPESPPRVEMAGPDEPTPAPAPGQTGAGSGAGSGEGGGT